MISAASVFSNGINGAELYYLYTERFYVLCAKNTTKRLVSPTTTIRVKLRNNGRQMHPCGVYGNGHKTGYSGMKKKEWTAVSSSLFYVAR